MTALLGLDGEPSPCSNVIPWPNNRRHFLSTKPRAKAGRTEKRCVGDAAVLSPPNWESGVLRPEQSGLNSQGKVTTGGEASVFSVPRDSDHKTIFEQKFIKLTSLYPGVTGLGNNPIQDNRDTYRPLCPQHADQPKSKEH